MALNQHSKRFTFSLLVNNNWGPKAYHKYQGHFQEF